MSRAWNWQRWGKPEDLIHKSDLYSIVGKFGCTEQFKRRKEEQAAGGHIVRENISGKLALGNAIHSTIQEVASNYTAEQIPRLSNFGVQARVKVHLAKEAEGLPIEWYRANPEKLISEAVEMVIGLFKVWPEHIGTVIMTEAAFVFPFGEYWIGGHVDLIYMRPGSDQISFLDWKSGAQLPHPIELEHGWESAIYANALRNGFFFPHESITPVNGESHREAAERRLMLTAKEWSTLDGSILDSDRFLSEIMASRRGERFDQWPESIWHVHLRDFVPYTRVGKKKMDRPEQYVWAGMDKPGDYKYQKGMLRGPGFYRVHLRESDTPRLEHLLRAVVSWVRFGRFAAAPGEMCVRCRYKEPCLTDGYGPKGEDKRHLDQITKAVDFDGFA